MSLLCEKYLIDKFDQERYLTITLRVMEEQSLNIYLKSIKEKWDMNFKFNFLISVIITYENNLIRFKGGVEEGFFNVYLIHEKYFIDKFDLKSGMILEKKLNKYLICRKERWDLTINMIWICKQVRLNKLIKWISYLGTNVSNLMIS